MGLHYLTLDRSHRRFPAAKHNASDSRRKLAAAWSACCTFSTNPVLDCTHEITPACWQASNASATWGNTVLVVEHDEDTMRAADYLVDFGPGPGIRGGEIVARGSPAEVFAQLKSLTGQYLTGTKQIAIPEKRRKPNGKAIRIVGRDTQQPEGRDRGDSAWSYSSA